MGRILSGSIIALNSNHKCVIIVGLLNDFVYEKTDAGPPKLMMVNPDLDYLEKLCLSYANKLRSMNSNLSVFLTIPTCVDFVEYTKKVKYLSQMDFDRLEDFSSQIMKAFKRLHTSFRYASKTLFCYNMNITLRDGRLMNKRKENQNPKTSDLMCFPPGTLLDGFRMSPDAIAQVASDITMRALKTVPPMPAVSVSILILLFSDQSYSLSKTKINFSHQLNGFRWNHL